MLSVPAVWFCLSFSLSARERTEWAYKQIVFSAADDIMYGNFVAYTKWTQPEYGGMRSGQ